MEYIFFIGIAAIIIVTVFIATAISSNKKLKTKLGQIFGKAPRNQDYDIDSIDDYHCCMEITGDSTTWVDDITWDDLDMDKVFKRINICCTSIGEEYLFHILHKPCFDGDELNKREKLIKYFNENPSQRFNLQFILSRLGKRKSSGLSLLIGRKGLYPLKHSFIYNILALLPIAGLIILPFNIAAGAAILPVAILTNIIVYYSTKKKIEADIITLEYFAALLFCCKKICDIKDSQFDVLVSDVRKAYDVFKHLRGRFSMISNKSFSDADIFSDYINITFLSEIRNYNKVVKCITDNNECFHDLYKSIGELDACISILSFRKSSVFFCLPSFSEKREVSFEKIYHPLLSNPVTNNSSIYNSCIVTGSNASGKSTFIKAIAVNSILAQTINTCCAESFLLKPALVITSMAVRDSISEGESYFITEIKSLKRILDKIDEVYCLCFIDEILKGTNTIERIASSAAVMEYLYERDCLCMVASHDIELTQMLKNFYDNYHFAEQITDDGIYFDYLVKDGASKTRNAVKLLNFMGFDDTLIKRAEAHVDYFEKNQKWK